MKKISVLLIIFFFFYNIGSNCFAQEKKDTLKILFVGNSYTYYKNMPQIISLMSNDINTKLITRKSTIGGSKLREHWLGIRNLKTKEIIKNGGFDIVVLQEHSMGAIKQPDSLKKFAKLFCDFIKKNNASPYLYLTWAREKTPQMQEIINSVYAKIAIENNATIVPVGKAWELAKQMNPKINLYASDGSHPSKLGAYLTAAVFTKILSEENLNLQKMNFKTTDFKGESIELMKVNDEEALFCYKVINQINYN